MGASSSDTSLFVLQWQVSMDWSNLLSILSPHPKNIWVDQCTCTACCCSVVSALHACLLVLGKRRRAATLLTKAIQPRDNSDGTRWTNASFFCLDVKKDVLFCMLFQCILLLIIPLRLFFRSQAYVWSHASKLCFSSSRDSDALYTREMWGIKRLKL